MKIISNKKYQAFRNVIIKQQKMIDDRDKKIKELEDRIRFLQIRHDLKEMTFVSLRPDYSDIKFGD